MQLAIQMNTLTDRQEFLKTFAKYALAILAVFAVFAVFADFAIASTANDEFKASSTKVEGWLKGNLGKTIILGGLIISLAVFAWTRDFKALFLPLIAAVVIGVIVGIINTTFTAVI